MAGINGLAPQGTAPLNGKVFMDKTEVTNKSWSEYVAYVKKENGADSEAYKAALPDMSLWQKVYPVEFDNLGNYKYYPVVGVNFPQVLSYCRWRSEKVSKMRRKKIVYKLPTFEEFYLASEQNSDSPAADLYSTKFDHRRNFIGICDNAAEMTNIEGLAINGFWGEECLDSLRYLSNGDRLGFRCVASFKK